MTRIRKFTVAGGTFAVALGIGFVMQNGDVLAARFGDPRPVTEPPRALTPALTSAPVVTVAAHGGGALVPPRQDHAEAAQSVIRPPLALPSESGASTVGGFDLRATALPDITSVAAAPPGPQTGALPDMLPAAPAELSVPVLGSAPEVRPESIAPQQAPQPVALELPPEAAAAPVPTPASACEVTLSAEPMALALVNLELAAPCAPGARVTFHHLGMMFSAETDAQGLALVTVPALAADAVFIADLGEGQGAVAMTSVSDLGGMNRAVLQWQGDTGLQLHAREFGADYGDEGDVWAGNPQDIAATIQEGGGFLVELGDPAALNPLLAQVYTMPAGESGVVRMTVEAEITADNCGREIAAQSLQIVPGAEIAVQDLTLTLPDCAATGEFLVLNGMLSDLQLAAN